MAAGVSWPLVRLLIERCQIEDQRWAPVDQRVQESITEAFKNAQSGVESEVRDHLAHYVAARNAIATSPEGWLLRLSPFPAMVGSLSIAVFLNIRLDLAFVGALVLPWASIHIRLKEQFETKRKEFQIALWKTVHQEHKAPAPVESKDSAQPISIERFRVWQSDWITSSGQIQAEIARLQDQLTDSPSKTALIEALQSLVNARQIVVDRAQISLFPSLGGVALFGAIGIFNEYTGYLPIPDLNNALFLLLLVAAGGIGASFAYLNSASMNKARRKMNKSFYKAMAYMPQPQEL